MPHIHLQTSADLPENTGLSDILESLIAALSSAESIDPKTIKAYHTLRSVWAIGKGAEPGFAACEVSLLAGRPEAIRSSIADRMFAAMRSAFSQSADAGEVNITLEVREMAPATYRR